MMKSLLSNFLFVLACLFGGIPLAISQTTFNYTGSVQTYVVPAGITSITIECYGAQGGHGGPSTTGLGGLGGYAVGELTVTPGQTLNVYVGGQGQSYVLNGTGGFNGGAGTNATSDDDKRPGCGGGASDVRVGGTALTDRVIVAGGGGGASGWMNSNGGMGGGLVGEDGLAPLWQPDWNGKGGTQSAGGTGGDNAGDGTLGNGGSGLGNSHGGGGGGGGYYGGGGGKVDAGGGGSSYIGGVTNGATTAGMQTGDGMIVITPNCAPTSLTPDVATLTDANGECSVTPTAPTATNDCGAVITGTPDVAMPVTAQGTTVVTWTYDDGVNIVTQTQNVVITDVTAPVADVATLPDLTDICGTSSLTPPTATDNCMGVITGTTDAVLPYNISGTSTITWTYDDGNGNVSTQTQTVINPAIDNGVTQTGVLLTADEAAATYQWLDCDNGFAAISGEVNQSYTPPVTGNYAVEITMGGCVDTSACLLVDYTGIEELTAQELSLYPNPATGDIITINFNGVINSIQIIDMLGRVVEVPVDLTAKEINISELTSGTYFVRISTESVIVTKEIVVTR